MSVPNIPPFNNTDALFGLDDPLQQPHQVLPLDEKTRQFFLDMVPFFNEVQERIDENLSKKEVIEHSENILKRLIGNVPEDSVISQKVANKKIHNYVETFVNLRYGEGDGTGIDEIYSLYQITHADKLIIAECVETKKELESIPKNGKLDPKTEDDWVLFMTEQYSIRYPDIDLKSDECDQTAIEFIKQMKKIIPFNQIHRIMEHWKKVPTSIRIELEVKGRINFDYDNFWKNATLKDLTTLKKKVETPRSVELSHFTYDDKDLITSYWQAETNLCRIANKYLTEWYHYRKEKTLLELDYYIGIRKSSKS